VKRHPMHLRAEPRRRPLRRERLTTIALQPEIVFYEILHEFALGFLDPRLLVPKTLKSGRRLFGDHRSCRRPMRALPSRRAPFRAAVGQSDDCAPSATRAALRPTYPRYPHPIQLMIAGRLPVNARRMQCRQMRRFGGYVDSRAESRFRAPGRYLDSWQAARNTIGNQNRPGA
jgi:hypothetical protein